jgi:hypothetical protein
VRSPAFGPGIASAEHLSSIGHHAFRRSPTPGGLDWLRIAFRE